MAQTADDGHPALTPPGMRADVCPVCGGPNECGGAAGKDQRWGSTLKISLETLVAVPFGAQQPTFGSPGGAPPTPPCPPPAPLSGPASSFFPPRPPPPTGPPG